MTPLSAYRISPNGSLPLRTQAATIDELTPQLPEGYYTTFRTFENGRRVLGLTAHLQRLYQPIADKKINPEVEVIESDLRQQMAKILKKYPGESRVRLVMTKNGELFMAISPLQELSPNHYIEGVKVISIELQRKNPRIKATSFISASKNERVELSQSDIFEALLVREGVILEGLTSNFFYLRDGVLGTARKDILLGVTRQTVLHVAQGSGFKIVYRPLKQRQVPALSEAFLTSSSRGIVPIIQINDMPVGEGVPGPVTKKLSDGYKFYISQHAELI